MKAQRFILIISIVLTSTALLFNSCSYDVSEPLWDQPYDQPVTPKILNVNPSPEVLPGVNTITITGQNLFASPDLTIVYFNSFKAEVVSMTAEKIVARRPNLATDSCTVKIVPPKAYVVAKYFPLKIDGVTQTYGGFLDKTVLGPMAVDNAENLYVVDGTTQRKIYKVTSATDKVVLANAQRSATDIRFGPDNNLYLLGNNRIVDKYDFAADTVIRWVQLPAGKAVRFGDFAANGYFYTGGVRTDLLIVPFNNPTASVNSGLYAADEILAVRVYNGYLYVLARTSTEPAKLWKHELHSDGTLGNKEQVFDLNLFADYSAYPLTGITFANNGLIYFSIDAPSVSMLVFNPANSTIDAFYKGIVYSNGNKICWGNSNYLYLLNGSTSITSDWNWSVTRVDMGTTGKP